LSTEVDDQIQRSLEALQRGNVILAEILCQNLLEAGVNDSRVFSVLVKIAETFGAQWRVVALLKKQSELNPSDATFRQNYTKAEKQWRLDSMRKAAPPARGILLIKAWGCGFCSDLDHTIGGLLLAEVTGRTPIAYWGLNSLYRGDGVENAWDSFFKPVSDLTIRDLVGKRYRFFPPKWVDENLFDEDVNRIEGFASRMAPLYYLNQTDHVCVVDFHAPVVQIMPWIPPANPYANKPIARVYRMIIDKFIRPRPEVLVEVDAFAKAHFRPRMIAAHLRGSDKPGEDANILSRNQECRAALAQRAANTPDAGIFLLSDDARIVESMKAEYGDRIVTTECVRTSNDVGLHLARTADPRRLGMEIMRDIYLATRCEQFCGVGTTNVAAMINQLERRITFLHER
jgi:hypothetical protein